MTPLGIPITRSLVWKDLHHALSISEWLIIGKLNTIKAVKQNVTGRANLKSQMIKIIANASRYKQKLWYF